jgi:hypothetical protein
MSKTVQQLRAAYKQGARWCVMVHYEAPSLGARGDIISTHRTYELARAAAKRSGWHDHLSMHELRAEACGQAA